jgi:plasmid stabilization system protein ParE
MTYRLLFFDEALSDVLQAKQWYNEQCEGLDEEFAQALVQAISQISEMPFAYAVRYKNIRIAHPKRFPFNIHFYVDEPNAIVVITAIVHNKRHPTKAQKRMK